MAGLAGVLPVLTRGLCLGAVDGLMHRAAGCFMRVLLPKQAPALLSCVGVCSLSLAGGGRVNVMVLPRACVVWRCNSPVASVAACLGLLGSHCLFVASLVRFGQRTAPPRVRLRLIDPLYEQVISSAYMMRSTSCVLYTPRIYIGREHDSGSSPNYRDSS